VNPYEHLSQEERLRRIGELLSKGVTRMLEAEKNAAQKAGEAAVAAKVEETEGDWITRGIVVYLKRVGWATPQQIGLALDVKRSTCFRRLKALLERGVLETRGQTRGAQYRIRANDLPGSATEAKPEVTYKEPATPAAMIRAAVEALEKQTARNWKAQRDEALGALRGAAEWVECRILHEKPAAFASK